ncbi:hypothetical protein QEH52_08665 [Coraliomargarita sp. SDUM461003]|uniref:Oligogalacturonate lyase domain-containing protein n=1 Tax=Thalassobacterium maritimum TaxID=3041265 RepID=A0ABU1AWD2_9BACT|nr:hypothetical protein [Coraliomargarita sp. SDUM461003]MDQ8207579.1 hypothetical protein [Coraliomargarita sp. SDUM461003]
MNTPKIDIADTWRSSSPTAGVPDLLIEREGRMQQLDGQLNLKHDFGAVGPVDCPIAYDPVRRLAFRYVSAAGYRGRDYSQLRAFSVAAGESYSLLELPLNQWALWMLEWIASTQGAAGQLLGLHAMDRPGEDRVVIEHRLFSLKLGADQLRLRPICRDAYKPLAFSRRRGEFIFAGAEGIYLLGLKGERQLTLPPESDAGGEGAAFHPSGAAEAVIGGDGLHHWDLERNLCRRLTRNGRHPVWTPDGRGVWYRESSADVHYYDFEQDRTHRVLGLASQRHPEFWHARPVCLSADGRYLATSLTHKVLRGVSQKGTATGTRERVYAHEHQLLVLDLERQTYWGRAGYASQLCWAQ